MLHGYTCVDSLQCNTLWYTFIVLLSRARTNKEDGSLTREHSTYNCSWEKHVFFKFRPQTLKDCPCDLLIVMVHARRIGNWIRLNSKCILVGIAGILGMRTSTPLNFPLSIVAWITLIINVHVTKRNLLHYYGWFRFQSMMTTKQIFSFKLCVGEPSTFKELKNSVG